VIILYKPHRGGLMSRQSKLSTEDKLAIVMATIKGEEGITSIARLDQRDITIIKEELDSLPQGIRPTLILTTVASVQLLTTGG
jgi:hypothetical protein